MTLMPLSVRPIAFKYPLLEGCGAIRDHYRLFTLPQIMTVSMTETINQDRSLRQDVFYVTSAISRCRMRSYTILRDSSPGSKKENLHKGELS